MRRRGWIVAVWLLVGAQWAPQAGAQFGCPGCAKEWTQLANNAELVYIAGQEARQLATQINQYRHMLEQGRALSPWMIRNVVGDLTRLSSIVADGSETAGAAAEFDRKFREAYRHYSVYEAAANQNYGQAYRRWNTNRMNAVRDAYYSAGLHAEMFRDEDAAAREIERQMQTATGQMQVLQASGAIARMEVEQMQKLRQLLTVQIKMQGEVIAAESERQASGSSRRRRSKVRCGTPSTKASWEERSARAGASTEQGEGMCVSPGALRVIRRKLDYRRTRVRCGS